MMSLFKWAKYKTIIEAESLRSDSEKFRKEYLGEFQPVIRKR